MCILLSFLIILAYMPGMAYAEDSASEDGLSWNISDGILTISGTGDMADYTSAKPAPWYDERSSVTGIVLENGVTSIGSYAFQEMNNATSITIPASINHVGRYAFNKTNGIMDVYLQDLTAWLKADVASHPVSVSVSGEHRMYINGKELSDLVIPEDIEVVRTSAFAGVDSITSVTFQKGTRVISENAFQKCSYLKKVDFGPTVERVEKNAFELSEIPEIHINGSMKYMGKSSFYNNNTNTSVYLDDLASWFQIQMDGSPFYNASDSVTNRLFVKGKLVTDLVIPDGIENIAPYSCAGLKDVTSIYIPDGVTDLSRFSFSGCTNLKKVRIPRSVSAIYFNRNYSAFDDCKSLREIELDDIDSWISWHRENPTHKLASSSKEGLRLYIEGKLLNKFEMDHCSGIPEYTFAKMNDITSVKISYLSGNIERDAFVYCDGIRDIKLLGTSSKPVNLDMEVFKDCTALECVQLGGGISAIGKRCFQGCTNLSSIDIGPDVASIEEYAFYDCETLGHVDVPKNVTKLGDRSFYDCNNLVAIAIYNPECSIGSTLVSKAYQTEIWGYEGSTAQNYAETNKLPFYPLIDESEAMLSDDTVSFIAGPQEPEVHIPGLEENVDFEVEYVDNVRPGTAKVIVYGIGKYRGYFELPFEIAVTDPDISHYEASVLDCNVYNGEEQFPAFEIEGLQYGLDYVIDFMGMDHTSAGTAKAVICGINRFTGEKEITFRIHKAEQSVRGPSSVKGTYLGTIVLSMTAPGKISYKSGNKKIAAVSSSGKVTCKGVGKTSITVSAASTSNYLASPSRKITVKVNPKKAGVKSVAVGKKKMTVKMSSKVSSTGGSKYRIAYRVKGTSKWKYKTTEKQSYTIKKLKKGKKYQVKVQAYKSSYCSDWSAIKTSKKVK